MPNQNQGFTLIELLLTLVVLSIALALAIPSFTAALDSVRQRTQVNQLLADLNFARSRAITSRRPVSICAGASGCDGLKDWGGQILIFDDTDGDGAFTATDDVPLRVTSISANHSWRWRNFRQQRHMTFKPDGTTHSLNGSFILCRQEVALRKIVINITGRTRLTAPTVEDLCS
ncbi:MAG: prepilin-type cleavage/methylation domain-containing protein [Pseudomonas sp.]|nr:prepilin-type cleavage/methylation domain-containing protein [Pseudomonas sp.]|tara:strand:- start:5677 stop:6198 length:522 start_codon:yes stop_codon:yes gene_type:complete